MIVIGHFVWTILSILLVFSLLGVADHSGKIIIKPFSYKVLPDAHLWLRKADSFILKVREK